MKKSIFRTCLALALSSGASLPLFAETPEATNAPAPQSLAVPSTAAVVTPTPAPAPVPNLAPAEAAAPAAVAAASEPAPVKLPYGVDDVLKLSRSQISEEVILNYISNSGTIYNLNPKDIVYLRNEGVSDRVINAMLDQRKRVPAEAAAQAQVAQAAPQPAAPAAAPTVAYDPNAVAAQTAQAAPVYVQPPQPEVQVAPAPSTVYVIPYPAASAAYYGYYRPWGYGYYGSPYSYYGPSVSFGFRFGGGHYYHHH